MIMIASTLYHQASGNQKAPTLLKYVTQRSLAVVLFIALAVLASIGNKPSDKGSPVVSHNRSISQPSGLFAKTVRAIKDAFNDPALIEYAKEQGVDIPDSRTTPPPNTSQPVSVRSKPVSSQSSKPSSSY